MPGAGDSQDSRWISTDACVWDGPTCLKKIPRLREIYTDQEAFFCKTIGLGAANLKTLVDEAKLITATDSLPYIRNVFEQLSHMSYGTYWYTRLDAKLHELLNLEIFPVWTGRPGPHFDCLRRAKEPGGANLWYIADVQFISDAFEERVALLAFEPSMLDEIKHLLINLGLEDRKLLKLAKMDLSIQGFGKLNLQYTQSLQEKWTCIAR